jgi:hypothetical protein
MAEKIKVGFVVFECPNCARKHSARADFAGLKAKCLGCGTALRVPARGQKARAVTDEPDAGEVTEQLPAPRHGSAKAKRTKRKTDGVSRVEIGSDGLAHLVLDDAEKENVDEPASFRDQEAEWEEPGRRYTAPAYDKKQSLKRIAAVSAIVLILIGTGYSIYLFLRPVRSIEASAKAAEHGQAQEEGEYEDEAGNRIDRFGKLLPPKDAAAKRPAATEAAKANATQPAAGTARGSQAAPKRMVKFTAAQLARADARDVRATNQEFKGVAMEVRGMFLATTTVNPLRIPPRGEILLKTPGPRLHAVFAEGDTPQVYCDLDKSATPVEVWKRLQLGQVITVRGIFNADRTLFDCELIRTSAAADDLYANREVGIIGTLESVTLEGGDGFPVMQLERDTRSLLDVKFAFRRPDVELLRSLRVGQAVTVAGTSKGIRSKAIRFENCRIVSASDSGSGPLLVPINLVIREYEKDYATDEAAPAEADRGPPIALRAPQLAREYESDPAQASRRILNKAVILKGDVHQFLPNLKKITLEGDTDQKVQVHCLFRASKFRELESLKARDAIVVRGVCGGLQDKHILRIDECERVDKPVEDAKTITAEYYPFKVGQKLVYDSADASRSVRRRIFYYREGQIIEYATLRQGVLRGRGLLEDGTVKWIKNLNLYAADVFHYRISQVYIEIGTNLKDARGRDTVVWEQVLKLGARAGDSWTNGERLYSVTGFAEHQGRPAAMVLEKFKPQGRAYPVQIAHVYVKDVGEVERRTFDVVPGRASKTLIAEVKLVEGEQ